MERRKKDPNAGRPTVEEIYEKYALSDDGLHHVPGTPWENLVRHDLGSRARRRRPQGPRR